MNITVEDISPTRKRVVVVVPGSTIREEEGKVLNKFVKQVRLPGFRPGKAPSTMVRTRFKKQIKDELDQAVTSAAYQKIIDQEKFDLDAITEVDNPQLVPGEDATINFTVEIRPPFELPEYKAIEVTVPPSAATEDEVAMAREHVLNQRADYVEVERAAAEGDYVKVSYEGKVDDKPIAELAPDAAIWGTQQNTWEQVRTEGAEGVPAVSAVVTALPGMAIGEKKTVEQVLPDDFPLESLRGKKAVYSMEVHEVREKKLPELDEAFFKTFGVDNEEAFMQRLREDIENDKKRRNDDQVRNQVLDKILAKLDIPLPETALERETGRILEELMRRNLSRGVAEEELEKHKEKLYEGAVQSAHGRVKTQLVLGRIAEKEGIKVENEDMQQAIMQHAMMTRTKPEQLVNDLRRNRGRVQEMQRNVLFEKTLAFLVSQAIVNESADAAGASAESSS